MSAPIFLDGPPARSPRWWWWAMIAVAAAGAFALPSFVELNVVFDLSIICVYALLALSMSFLWGYGGMLSFGQTAMFGVGGYVYAIVALNTGATSGAFLLAILAAMAFSGLLGYFMIYGRISDIYFTVITLVTTVVLEKAVRATSDPRFRIGEVQLNGQNGIASVPDLQLPWDTSVTLFLDGVYYLAAGLLLLVYVGMRLLLTTTFGRVLVGIRDNERRVQLLGYDSRRYKLMAFVLSGGIAGLAGVLYAVWGNFVAPEMMNLNSAANVVIYTIVGGKATLVGPIFGTAIVQHLTSWLGTIGVGQVTVVMGTILLLVVMVFPLGVLPTTGLLINWVRRRGRKR